MAAYLLNARTGILFNFPVYALYSSFPVGVVILAGPDGWVAALVLTSVVSLVVGYVLEEEFGFEVSHWGPRPGQVSRFIRTARMTYPEADVIRKVDLSIGEFDRR